MKHFTFFTNFFKAPTLVEICTNDIIVERKLIAECDQTITNALFQKALSLAKLKAMQEWLATASSTNQPLRKDS